MDKTLLYFKELENMNLDCNEKFILQMHYNIIELSMKEKLEPYNKYLKIMKKLNDA